MRCPAAAGGRPRACSQAKRPRSARRAAGPASAAPQPLLKASSMAPRGCPLRQRYPQQVPSAGTARTPALGGGSLGGALAVAELAGGAGIAGQDCGKSKKIQRNLRILQACSQSCGEQQQLLASKQSKLACNAGFIIQFLPSLLQQQRLLEINTLRHTHRPTINY